MAKKNPTVSIKGRVPAVRYTLTLAEAFAGHQQNVYAQKEADILLSSHADALPGISTRFVSSIFPPATIAEHRPYERLPAVMGEAPPEKLEFNLRYQDTRIKLAVEDKLGGGREFDEYRKDAQALMQVAAILLRCTGVERPALWQDLTDNDLDAVMYQILDAYDSKRKEELLETGLETNRRALAGMDEAGQLSLDVLISHQIFAGTVWWLKSPPDLKSQFAEFGELKLDDTLLFKQDVLLTPCRLIFFFDDNGELVWDLALIQRLLQENPELEVVGVVTTSIVANNANKHTLDQCLAHPFFAELKTGGRFSRFEEENPRSAIDPCFCSRTLLDLVDSASCIYIKGVSFFETIQGLPKDTFYGFVVHSHDSQLCTGLKSGDGVFVCLPKGRVGYLYLKKTLAEIYSDLREERTEQLSQGAEV